jgi:3-deoxy-D-manno-octulosonic-acid transferase
MPLGIALLLYNLLLPVVLLCSLPGYIAKMIRRGGYAGHFRERLGIYPDAVRDRLEAMSSAPLWIHAVSVGEVLIAAKLIAELRRQAPDIPLVISTTTSTGHAVALERLGEVAVVIYNPLDFRWIIRLSLSRIAPRQLVLVEAEVWPNLVHLARKRGVGVSLVNARLSERSGRRFVRFGAVVRPVFGMLDHVYIAFERDRPRFAAIGVRSEAIQRMGSIKYDPGNSGGRPALADVFEATLERLWGGRKRRVFLAGSTHNGEERLFGEVFLQLREREPTLFYIAVPRHFERSTDVVRELREIGLHPLRRTEMDAQDDGAAEQEGNAKPAFDCLVVDSTGELQAWYCLADAVVIGKSFLSRGGQNPVEPILAGKPVFYGPAMGNFPVLAETLHEAGGACQVTDGEGLFMAVAEILKDPDRAGQMVARAREVLALHEGATARTAKALLRS